jgi:integrase-like protein
MEYPADPPRPEEIILVMRQAGQDRHGLRIRALVAVLWRGGLRIAEALALNETDVDARRGSLLIRHGKGDRRREAGMDQFGFEQLARLAGSPRGAAARTAVLRDRRRDPRAPLGSDVRAGTAAPARGRGRRPAPTRAPPATTRPRG